MMLFSSLVQSLVPAGNWVRTYCSANHRNRVLPGHNDPHFSTSDNKTVLPIVFRESVIFMISRQYNNFVASGLRTAGSCT